MCHLISPQFIHSGATTLFTPSCSILQVVLARHTDPQPPPVEFVIIKVVHLAIYTGNMSMSLKYIQATYISVSRVSRSLQHI